MILWLIFAALAGAVAFAMLRPLARRPAVADAAQGDVALYEAQLAEITRDLDRGLLTPVEAETLRAEAGRRLLRLQAGANGSESEVTLPSPRRTRTAALAIIGGVVIGGTGLYALNGQPWLPAKPLSERLSAEPGKLDVDVALARIEAHLAVNPGDARGWELIAPIYLRAGRIEDAARAYGALIRAAGPTADRLSDLGEARVLLAQGLVRQEAREVFAEAVKLEPAHPKALYFLAVAKEQEGDAAGAAAMLTAQLARTPADAPWRGLLSERLAKITGAPVGGDAIAALPPADQQTAIRGMVDGLSARLEAGGGTLAEFERLIRARVVLGERDKAQAALATALTRLSSDSAAITALKALADSLQIEVKG